MATFIFNKLIRNKLRSIYEDLQQKAKYRTLSNEEFSEALKQKLIEEAHEIDVTDRDVIVAELADVYQVIEDLMKVHKISAKEVEEVKAAKFKKKGGFSEALFVETLELRDDDEWNEYYRKSPEIYKELTDNEQNT